MPIRELLRIYEQMVEWWNLVLLEAIHKLVSMNLLRWIFEKTLLALERGGGGVWREINRV